MSSHKTINGGQENPPRKTETLRGGEEASTLLHGGHGGVGGWSQGFLLARTTHVQSGGFTSSPSCRYRPNTAAGKRRCSHLDVSSSRGVSCRLGSGGFSCGRPVMLLSCCSAGGRRQPGSVSGFRQGNSSKSSFWVFLLQHPAEPARAAPGAARAKLHGPGGPGCECACGGAEIGRAHV